MKFEVLHLGWRNPRHLYRLEGPVLDSIRRDVANRDREVTVLP